MTSEVTIPRYALLRERSFLLYQLVRLSSVIAIQMMAAVAVPWQIYAATHDALALGYVGLAQFVPLSFMTIIAGEVADRVDRKRILMICHAGIAVLAGALYLLASRPTLEVLPIYGVLALFGVARAFAGPAGQAIGPLLVPPELFPRAVAWNAVAFQVALVTGPMLGGALLAAFGTRFLYAAAAVLEILVVLLLVFVTPRASERSPTMAAESPVDRLLAGFRFVRAKPVILGAISLDLCAVLLGGATALLPIYAREILQIGESGFGYLRASPAIGGLLVAGLLGVRPLERKTGALLLGSVFLYGVFTVMFGLSTWPWLSVLALALLGGADMVSVVVRQVLVQTQTPDAMRGRVSAVSMLFIGASNELGEMESGFVASLLGPVRTVVFGGVGAMGVALGWGKLFPELRAIEKGGTPG